MPQLPPVTPKPRSFFQRYWLQLVIGTAIFFFILAQIIRLLTPTTPVAQNNTWNTVTPGKTTLSEVETRLGPPLKTVETADGTQLQYQSVYPALPQQVLVDKDQKVKFIKEYFEYKPENTLDTVIQKFGQPDLEMIDTDTGNNSTAFVFLKEGVVVVATNSNKVIEQKWYFVPTSKEDFLQNAGKSLTLQESGPEPVQ